MSHNDGQLPYPAAKKPADMSTEELTACLATAKAVEAAAQEKRIEWEELVAERLGGPEDGGKTFTLKDGTKVTVTRGFNFTADCEGIRRLFRMEQYDHAPPVASKTTVKLDEAAYKQYAKQFPSVYDRITRFVTVKPKKTAVTLKAKKA